jgi:hypothetical protein
MKIPERIPILLLAQAMTGCGAWADDAGQHRGVLMWRPYSLPLVASFTVVVLLLAACSGSSDESADTTFAPSTTEQATTTTTASTTVAAATTSTEAQPDSEGSESGEEWDLVWISDSYGAGVAKAWANRIEESEGVEVRVHDYIIGSLTIENTRLMVTDELVAAQGRVTSHEGLSDELADAEIIVVYGNASQTAPSDVWTCARSGADPREPPEYHTLADFAPYGDVFREVFDVVFALRAGRPTVIRTYDAFAAALADWREAGIEPECTASWEAQAAAIHEAADEYGVLTASFYDKFNGVDHNEDAREKGYIADDGWHQSQGAGVNAQVEVLHALGYDPIIP